MKFNDAQAVALLQDADSPELFSDIESYAEEEVGTRSDMQILSDELGWVLGKFEEEGWTQHQMLTDARQLLRETKGGKEFQGTYLSAQLKRLQRDIEDARDVIGEYDRLKRLMKKLQKQGYISAWY